MNKLLRADFARLKKDVFFWISLAASFFCGIVFAALSLWGWSFENDFVFLLFLVIGAFVAMFVYRENSNGAIRNKVVVGHTKGAIYLSGLMVHGFAALVMALAFLLPICLLCIEWLTRSPVHAILIMIGGTVLASLTCAVIFTVVMYLIPQKIIGALLCPILVMGMFFASNMADFYLNQPDPITIDYELENGEMAEKTEPNPRAVKGVGRVLLTAVDSLMPQGQTNCYFSYLGLWAHKEVELPDDFFEPDDSELTDLSDLYDVFLDTLNGMLPYMPLYSIGLSGVLTWAGWAAFRKKELK